MEIGDAQSRMVPTTMGVPQGSVIGTLLYAVYTNEMTETTKRNDCKNTAHRDTRTLFGQQCTDCGVLSLYADDCTFTVSSKVRDENQNRIRTTLDEIALFLNDNNLVINQTKTSITECMVAQKKGKTTGTPPHLNVEKEPGVIKRIENKEYTRILGANIQGNVLWSNHLETGDKALLPQVRKQLGSLKHLGGQIPANCKMKLARGLILGKMNYLMPIWGAATHSHLRRAQVLLNDTARWVTGASKRTRISRLMDLTGWLTVKEQVEMSTALLIWKMIHLSKPERPRERLSVNEMLEIQIESPRLLVTEQAFRWRSALEWNNIPLNIRQIENVDNFKKNLKKWILLKRSAPAEPD